MRFFLNHQKDGFENSSDREISGKKIRNVGSVTLKLSARPSCGRAESAVGYMSLGERTGWLYSSGNLGHIDDLHLEYHCKRRLVLRIEGNEPGLTKNMQK